MRLFVAVEPPPDARAELAAALRPLHALPQAGRLRWTAPEHWHLTLAFLGEVDEAALPELTRRLARAAHRHPAHRLRLAGGGRFGDRTLWAGVGGETLALRRLAESVQAAARRTGLAVDERRPYRAHLTLARSAGGGRGPDLRGAAAVLAEFRGREWQAAEIRLVRSVLGAGPPWHSTLDAWPLARSGPADGPPAPPE
ncbi:RNA 2',3'-cyclic phosphodiesterase [Streptomyces sp. NPDC092296]|uniref:RNA 2',3'-cyclic phosphodiesterase n=1 Tax=Streptomyces sp. NPDC092296 TaxID=3366012 RepID=UPI00382D44D2